MDGGAEDPKKPQSENKQQIIDFSEVREQRLEVKRRRTERMFFKNLLSVYSVTGNKEPFPVDLINISEEGILFQIPHTVNNEPLMQKEEFPIRLYFSAETYLEILVRVQYTRPSIENHCRYTRFGCKVDQTTQSYPAFRAFVQFLRLYSETSHKDKGNMTVFYL